ncbi:hypothetical protein BRC71_06325 [Halobacteriales archaeon QH_7_65_31]|nr:MAG: hypothetical protein BRC71_06325 [Halobacteriales archaeon QH_7_65_31]
MSVQDTLSEMAREPRPLSPFDDFETAANVPDRVSDVLTLQADTVLALRDGASLQVTIPAYETFGTDGNAGNSETFQLAHDLADSPNVPSVVLYEDASQVEPDSIDTDADSITYTAEAANATLHVFYVTGTAATLTLEKRLPGGKTSASKELKTVNLALANRRDQQENPIRLSFSSWLERYVAMDMELVAVVNAPYEVAFEPVDGVRATNTLFHTTATQGQSNAPGLLAAIRDNLGQ